MSRSYYSEINLHIVWHTNNCLPLLTPEVEPLAHRFVKSRVMKTESTFIHEIGGIENHVHLVVTIPPTLLISDWIGQLKGGSSHDVNQAMEKRQKVLQWQVGYGVVSFGTRDLDWVKAYVRNQRQHHEYKSTHERLERATQFDEG